MSETPFLDVVQSQDSDMGMATGVLVLANWITPDGEKAWGWEGEGEMDIMNMFGIMGRMAAELQKDITVAALRKQDDGDE